MTPASMTTADEPIYEFVKGVGWVIRNYESYEFTTRHGIFRAVNRYPNDDEMFVSFDDRDLKAVAMHCISCNWKKGINSYKTSRLWARETCIAIEYVGPV